MLALALAAPAAAQDVTTQFWPEIDTYVHLSDRSRIYVPLSVTKAGIGDSEQDGTAGIYYDYFALPLEDPWFTGLWHESRGRRLRLRAGYGYTAPGNGEPSTSTVRVEVTGYQPLPWDIVAGLRNRFDLNFSGGNFDPVYRVRLKLQRKVPIGGPTLVPYAYGEFFYDFNDGDWAKKRFVAGFEFRLWERVVPEIYYQHDYTGQSSNDTRGIGLTISLYLR